MANPRINLLTLPRSAAHRDAREIGRNILNDAAAIDACLPVLELYFRARFAPVAPSSMSEEQAIAAAQKLARKFRRGIADSLAQTASQSIETEADHA